jgi:hypothetical protein
MVVQYLYNHNKLGASQNIEIRIIDGAVPALCNGFPAPGNELVGGYDVEVDMELAHHDMRPSCSYCWTKLIGVCNECILHAQRHSKTIDIGPTFDIAQLANFGPDKRWEARQAIV